MVRVYRADQEGLPANDRGLAYGDGLFETILAEGPRAALLPWHLERLNRDAGRLGIPIVRGEIETLLTQALADFAGYYGGGRWILKATLTRGAGGRGYRPDKHMEPNLLLVHAPAPPRPPAAGVTVDFSPVPLTVNPILSGIKSLNRLEQVMAARELGADLFEVLMSNAEGHVVEGTRTNLFVATEEGWLTPPQSTLAVAGVMRRVVLEHLWSAGEPVTEAPVTLEVLMSERCKGVCLTNSVLGIVPVRNLAGQAVPMDNRLSLLCGLSTEME